MKCSNCCNNISSCRDCVFCGKKFCCFICLEAHYLHEHKNQKNDSSKSKDKKSQNVIKNENDENKVSPYLVRGIFNKKIIYDLKYELDNFTPVMDGKDLKSIGSGSFGQVYLAKNNLDNKMYAIKHMDKEKLIDILHTLQGIYEEIFIQSRLDHPNIVKILFTDEDEDSFDLVMEYAESGSLFHYIRKNKGLSEYKTFQLFIQVVNAVNFLHENDLIHRDIKPENILLFKNDNKKDGILADYTVKLCDFGWCVKLNGEKRDTFCGTTEYMSPELVNHKVYSKEIDVWSLGILLYEMLHGYSPFRPNKPKFEEKDVFNNIKKHKIKYGKKVSQECKLLIENLLAFNKNKRYKVEDIYNSKFVKKFEKISYCLPKVLNENISNNKKSVIDNSDIDRKSQKEKNSNSCIALKNKTVINRYNIKKVNNSRQPELYKNLTSNFPDSTNNDNVNLITVKSGLLPENVIKKESFSNPEKTKNNNNNRKSPDMKNNQNSKNSLSNLFNSKININIKSQKSPPDRKNKDNKINILKINNSNSNSPNVGKKVIHKKKISSVSPRRMNYNSNCNKNENNYIFKLNKKISSYRPKRKINSVKNNNNINIDIKKEKGNEFHSSNFSHEKLNNNNNKISNTNITNKKKINFFGINKNLFNDISNDYSRIQSDRINNKQNKRKNSNTQSANLIIIKSKKAEGNKNEGRLMNRTKNISPVHYQGLIRNKTSQELIGISPPKLKINSNIKIKNNIHQKEITNIKLQNKKSFCFVSRNDNNNNKSDPINKINNINYQSNNINNFYIINSNNMNNTGTHSNQKSMKKITTEKRRDIKKNMDYLSLIETQYVDNTYRNNKTKNINVNVNKNIKNKSLSKKNDKRSLKHCFVDNHKDKRVHSYNNNNNRKKRIKGKSKETDSVICGDSEFSDEAEKNITPKKKKDKVKINPLQLLGNFKEEFTLFHERRGKI